MSWRTVIITNTCKLSYKNNYMIIKNDKLEMIHLSEINTLIIDTTMVSITSYLLCELVNRKIKVIFCDEQRNPISELVPYYGAHNTSKKVLQQIKFNEEIKDLVWKEIVKFKIINQSKILQNNINRGVDKLLSYVEEVKPGDITNREGHAAKVYFNFLFGKSFTRDLIIDTNFALNYGYSILLSTFNKEIVSKGYITQLGINHKNEFNYFNLSCDLMEPFRPLIDNIAFKNKGKYFDSDYKIKLVNVLNEKVKFDGKEQYVSNAVNLYVKSVFDALEKNDVSLLKNIDIEII